MNKPLTFAISTIENSDLINEDTTALLKQAAQIRDEQYGALVTYSRKVFIPLTELCRDVCHYCTFAKTPKRIDQAYLLAEDVVQRCRQAARLGCKEALFTLGEKPELRYQTASKALADLGYKTTVAYVAHVAEKVLNETGILPHINAGNLSREELTQLKAVSASMGLMLESTSTRLCEKGMPHYGSPDKQPQARLTTLKLAGELQIPFTTGLLIGIGETRQERIETLQSIAQLHAEYGHIQEVIVQNFRAKPGTLMAQSPEPDLAELLWTIAVARIILPASVSLQAPPNLSPGVLPQLIAAGINDWGGVSPVTPDYVNPEAPWPEINELEKQTSQSGKILTQRLTVYPSYIYRNSEWINTAVYKKLLALQDAEGYGREDHWQVGKPGAAPTVELHKSLRMDTLDTQIVALLAKSSQQQTLTAEEITTLFSARGDNMIAVLQAADKQRKNTVGDSVTYAVNRNINYTNVCYFACRFCAFSKGKKHENLRGKPYDITGEEIVRRCIEAQQRGATEVCLQGGIHPDYTGQTYLDIVSSIKQAAPDLHIHAFSPLEVSQGAATLGISVKTFLQQLKAAGLGSLPGTAAEILHDDIRQQICPDKLNSHDWLAVIKAAHEVGLKTTATIMFGHVEGYQHWAQHLLAIKKLAAITGGFTEFVPLPFVAEESPMYLRGLARKGPTFREVILMHAIARLVLAPHISNIQTSWVKLGPAVAAMCLQAGANDMGGSLMNESITRAAGAGHGQEMLPADIEALITQLNRQPQQRGTLYQAVEKSWQVDAQLLAEPINQPASKRSTNKVVAQ